MEIADLVKELEEKWGVSAAAPVAVAAAAGVEAVAEEKDSFDIELTGIGDKKIQVIKAVREITGLGLKEAKSVVDASPGPVKEGVSKDEGDQIIAKLEEVGARGELK